MDKAKQSGSSSSSFTMNLFGPKDSTTSLSSTSTSSTDLFRTIFGPPPVSSMVPSRDTSHSNLGHSYHPNAKPENTTDYYNKNVENTDEHEMNRKGDNPGYFNSSIYYGGQEVYFSIVNNKNNMITPVPHQKKEGGEVEQNESNSSCVSRGNWWRGSLYY